MAKTRGGHSASPSSPTPRPHRAAMGAVASPPVQAPAIPPSEGEAPSQRRYPTRRPPTDPVPLVDQATSPVSRPPAKRTKFSGPGEPSHAPQPDPPTEDSRIPADIPLETVIRRPMIAGPPIEGNLDCRDRSFHSETYFDIEILEHLGYPEQPRLERRRHCREDFSLDKWHHLVAYFAPEGAPAVPAPPELP
ncbi:vegetative cell wall protein gp1-like [Vitis vinifera]|uniref:vegetative cell wall protein gp1-like n=1 Tax=Vitis vinifera TaxID=29760 RepID=UPI0005400EB9|nr:vegetative cell wall protein gp1-like [Vitis vinifera]|eukprot:XP_010647438.1 PREDICTED: vegetative cell wall protein gp1-like [Vitis vinifera]